MPRCPMVSFSVGTVTSIPDARVKPDSCVEVQLTSQNPLQVTFLDAGSFITTQLGTRVDTIPRVTSTSRTTYEVTSRDRTDPETASSCAFPVWRGGFPAAEIRSKTAEAFTFDTLGIRPSPAAVQMRWTPSTDANSACWSSFVIRRVAGRRPTWSSAAHLWTTVSTR